MSLAMRDARVVVGLDFGTAFSGFAYAHRSSPGDVYKLYDWPDSTKVGGRPYCKTPTSLHYVHGGSDEMYELKEWGWTALVSYTAAVQRASRDHRQLQQEVHQKKNLLPQGRPLGKDDVGVYITKFKLHLAGEENARTSVVGPLAAEALPSGLSVERCITDYLGKISSFIFDQLQKRFGDQLTKKDVQWCLTVPAIWDGSAKQKMRMCAEKAGIVAGLSTPKEALPSPHPLLIILEPEAASFYSWNKSKHLGTDLKLNDQFLIADIGGGTTDIVVHAKASAHGAPLKLREVQASSGGLCGGTNVDMNFFHFLCREIGCLEAYVKENVALLLSLQGRWHTIKSTFDGEREIVHELDLPSGLATAWESHDRTKKLEPRTSGYEELSLTTADIRGILDPVVEEIIRLIDAKMTKQVKLLMVVGGFSASPYLMKRITQAFRHQVQQIINPPEPGCAICHGAVLMGICPSSHVIESRISRKTYGIEIVRPFKEGNDPSNLLMVGTDGNRWCCKTFLAFVHKGSEVKTDHCESKLLRPQDKNQRSLPISVFSCSRDVAPWYVTDDGVVAEGHFDMDISDHMGLGIERPVRVSMYFGRSSIEVRARRENFGDTSAVETLPVLVQFDL